MKGGDRKVISIKLCIDDLVEAIAAVILPVIYQDSSLIVFHMMIYDVYKP